MKEITTILCSVDFSEPSDTALGSAVDLAERIFAEIIPLFQAICNIDPMPSSLHTLTNHLADQIPQIMQQVTENASLALKKTIVQAVAYSQAGHRPHCQGNHTHNTL